MPGPMGAAAQLRVAVEAVPSVPEREHRQQEPRGRAGLADVERRPRSRGISPPRRARRRPRGRASTSSCTPRRRRHVEHRLGVVGEQRAASVLAPVGQGGAHQRAVGDALRPGHRDVGVERRGERLDRRARRSVESLHRRAGSPRAISPPRNRSAVRPPRRAGSATPRSPSAEWAISKSAMLTPSSAASVVTSASTPGRSGTGMRTSASSAGRATRRGRFAAGRAGPLEHARAAPSRSPSSTTSRMSASPAISRRASSTIASRFSRADVGPDAGWPGGDAGHVAEAAGGEAQQRGVLLGAVVGEAHQRGRGQVRHVATRPRPARRGARASSATTSAPSDDTTERDWAKASSSVSRRRA